MDATSDSDRKPPAAPDQTRRRHQATARTGLHAAAKGGHLQAVSLLLEHGADPNTREAGDNTYPLHWAAAHGHLEVVRALLDSGGDVHGVGDVHLLDVIGWATLYRAPDDDPAQMDAARRELVVYQLLKSRQLEAAQAALAGEPGDHAGIEFEQDIEHMFYGARQFCLRDLNDYKLYFIQSDEE